MYLDIYGDSLCALVTAAALASSGHHITLRPPNLAEWQSAVGKGRLDIQEPGLDRLFAEQISEGRLSVGDIKAPPRPEVSAVFLAVHSHQRALAEHVVTVSAPEAGRQRVVINQSPFPVGTTEELQLLCPQVPVVVLPELLQEGGALQSFMRPARLLLGCDDRDAEVLVREIFRPFNRLSDHFLVMGPREAEFTKLAITGMLATRVSYMNDMANLAETLGVDIENVRQGMGSDPRIGEAYLYAGCGFGGPGLSRDVLNLSEKLSTSGVGSELLRQVIEINERQKEVLFRKLWGHYDRNLEGKVVAIWGAAFKPGTGRVDNAPVERLLNALWAQGVIVKVHDPQALPTLRDRYGERPDLILCERPYDASQDADALMLVTEWKAYWSPDFDHLRQGMRSPVILDGRNIYDPAYLRQAGFIYYGVGR
ncbi:NDP-sugar dehydrogenase like UDP-glucose dehydrogenase [Alcanivorax balearicus MACL04]|uniref:UDP-glucose 6-dehydrogenase n=1 Tax=Alloalcanivorax balearicus MACL04 TaxID=1177182 RepID=A0ABT2R111_9GAMM|nr:nucleotide sugar dehydrogenase [Alloalcanivorax balearicus]MCU5783483.1 NDP-sugar dehydrogenase like UDP-glucose dehydrogenase [Alloalcanivorax balearicus MACL04]